MDRDLARAVANCSIAGNVIHLNGLTEEQTNTLKEIIYKDLLNFNIPNYRVIGVKVSDVKHSELNYFSKISGTNKSYIELSTASKDIICADGGGTCDSYLDLPEDFSYITSLEDVVTTSNNTMFYSGNGIDDLVKCLVLNQEVITFNNYSRKVSFVLRRGCGSLNYSDTGKILKYSEYKPVETVYSLTNWIYIPIGKCTSNKIDIWYNKNINEEVLTNIFRKYALDYLDEEDSI